MSKAGDTIGDLHADSGEFNHQRKSLISNKPDIGDLQRLLTKIAIAALGTLDDICRSPRSVYKSQSVSPALQAWFFSCERLTPLREM